MTPPTNAVPDAAPVYVLRLFVTGATERSQRAIANIRRICDEHLKGRYALEVVDIYQQAGAAAEGHILAVPTLIRELPAPLRRLIGDLSNTDAVLVGLDLQQKGAQTEKETPKGMPKGTAAKETHKGMRKEET